MTDIGSGGIGLDEGAEVPKPEGAEPKPVMGPRGESSKVGSTGREGAVGFGLGRPTEGAESGSRGGLADEPSIVEFQFGSRFVRFKPFMSPEPRGEGEEPILGLPAPEPAPDKPGGGVDSKRNPEGGVSPETPAPG